MGPSRGALVDTLRLHRLLRPEQLAELPQLAQGRLGNARGLARLLIQRGWLSIFQANQILAGRAAELTIGPYHVLDVLGKGGLSLVFKARHIENGWIVALKVLRAEAIADNVGRDQFLLEMEAMAELDHTNIVQFCDVDQSGETFYYAMEFVDGVDLGKHVALTGPLPVADACEYIRQSALGLQHAHERNLVHRDIKPANLYLTHVPVLQAGKLRSRKAPPTRPLIKILDWGLAMRRKTLGSGLADDACGAHGIVGTIDYLSPEQAKNGDVADARSDIYSLGCSMYFLLTGQPPFPRGNLAQKLMAHQIVQPVPIGEFRRDVPLEVLQVLSRMMAKKPEDRFHTPAAAALALKPFARLEQSPDLARPRPSDQGPRDDTPLPRTLQRPQLDTDVGTTSHSQHANLSRVVK